MFCEQKWDHDRDAELQEVLIYPANQKQRGTLATLSVSLTDDPDRNPQVKQDLSKAREDAKRVLKITITMSKNKQAMIIIMQVSISLTLGCTGGE